MSNRNDWEYEYTGGEILAAIEGKIEYHAERIAYWSKQKDVCEKEIMETGISLKDYQVTGGRRFEAQIDASLSQRYEEAWGKLDSHQYRLSEYVSYERAINHTGEHTYYSLTLDDILFFGL